MFWKRDVSPHYPPAPEGLVLHVTGDVHGRIDLLEQTFALIDGDTAPGPNHIEIYLGDYIDRGPASREVIDALIARSRTHTVVALAGNHEDMLMRVLEDPAALKPWIGLGGLATLTSYGLPGPAVRTLPPREIVARLKAAVSSSHRDFLDGLASSFRCGAYFFAHAGIRPGTALEKQSAQDLMWIRETFLNDRRDHGAVIVHGHTQVRAIGYHNNRINLDTGAYASGILSCIRIDRSGVQEFGAGR